MRYIVSYVAGYMDHGRAYSTIVDAPSPEVAGETVTAEKRLPPYSFDWVEIEDVELVEDWHNREDSGYAI